MSLDIDWSLLDETLALQCRAAVNRVLSVSPRPPSLGDIICTDFHFGDVQPDIELLDIRDIYEDFLEADEAAEAALEAARAPPPSSRGGSSRRVSPSNAASYSGRPAFARPSTLTRSATAPLHPSYFDRPMAMRRATAELFPPSPPPEEELPSRSPSPLPSTPAPSLAPSLQLHLRVTYSGTLRLSLKTTLLVNHPSPSFLALPVSLNLTALAFRGILVLAFQGDKKRLHLSLLDPGPASAETSPTRSSAAGGGPRLRPADRVLTDLVCESEVGQADKHVLRNVGKVEKFVLDMVRGALEDEIIWPNFQTIAWAAGDS